MANDEKFKTAQKLIDEFAEQLLALNNGKKIPTPWHARLKKALTPKPREAGRKIIHADVAEIAKRLILAGDEVWKPRTKHHNPALLKDLIAKETSTSRRSIERRITDIRQYLNCYAREISSMREAMNRGDRRKTGREIYFNKSNFDQFFAPEIKNHFERALNKAKMNMDSFRSTPIPPELHDAIVDGISEALRLQLLAEIEAEDRAMQQQEVRRKPK